MLVVTAALAMSCSEVGLSGPDWSVPESGSGPCFEVDIADGFADAAEVQLLFDCFNQHDAFVEVEPLVGHLLTSDRVDSLVGALDGLFEGFDVPEALRIGRRVLTSPDAPLDGMLGIYVELYDDDFLVPMLAVAQVATEDMDACERSDVPADCSVPRLLRRLLDTEMIELAGNVFDAIGSVPPREGTEALLQVLADLLVEMSPSANPARDSNPLLELGRFLLDERVEGGAPLDQTLDLLVPLLANAEFMDALVSELGRLHRDGALDALPSDIEILFTHDVDGNVVGFDGVTIVDELLTTLGTFDTSLLTEEVSLLGGEPATMLELALDLVEDLYAEGADTADIVAELVDVTDLICSSGSSNALCSLVSDLLPPIVAAVEQTEGVPDLVLPLLHVLNQHTDIEALLPFLEDFLAWDLLGRAEPLLRFTVERDLLTPVIDMVPAFIEDTFGRLRPAGEDAVALVRLLTEPLDDGGAAVVPLEVLLPLGRLLLSPPVPDADLDFLMGQLGLRLNDPASALSVDAIVALFEGLITTVDVEDIDLVELVTKLLDDTELWQGALHVLADPELIALLRPDPRGGDATWWLRDLIERDVLGRLMDFLAGILSGLADLGLLDDEDP